MMQVTLTIGHNVGNEQKLDTPAVCQAVTSLLGIEAFTAIPCYGMWRGMAENSTRIEIVCDEQTATSITQEVPFLAHMLGQEAIMCEVRTTTASFVAESVMA